MNARVQPGEVLLERRLPFECIALVLQGGGALGAYQAGVCLAGPGSATTMARPGFSAA